MFFKENKTLHKEEEVPERKPAWQDRGSAALKVDISKQSRLRKLKREEAEDSITGKFLCPLILSRLRVRKASQVSARGHCRQYRPLQLGPTCR